ncbi:MAG: DUF86 domain-containing protein [Acidobacteriota bacterium]
MKREYLDAVADILEAIEKALSFCEGMTFKTFAHDDKTVFAVIRALELIGEAAKKVPAGVRTKHTDIPWRDITGMRDKLVHEYFGVDLQTVWATVQQDLPALRPLIKRLYEDSIGTKKRG